MVKDTIPPPPNPAAPATTIAEYSQTANALAELRQKFAGVVFDVSTTGGMVEARAARGELRTLRTSLEAKRKEIKAPALKRCSEIDTEARRITAELSALEDPIDDLIKAEEQRKEREKAAKEEAERERIAEVNRRFDALRGLVPAAAGKTVEQISELITQAEAFDPRSFDDEVQPAATFERQLAINGLKALRDQREAQDVKDRETAAKLQRLEELERAEKQRAEAEQAVKAAAEKARQEEERQRTEKEAQERAQAEAARQEELRQREAEIAERERAAAAERAEADRVAREERERLAAEQQQRDAEARAQQRRDQEALEARERELEAERLRLEREKEERAIAGASLLEAAVGALALLHDHGLGRKLPARKLSAAIEREQTRMAA